MGGPWGPHGLAMGGGGASTCYPHWLPMLTGQLTSCCFAYVCFYNSACRLLLAKYGTPATAAAVLGVGGTVVNMN